MSKTISYRAVLIEKVTSAMLAGLLVGATKLVVAIDVAKTKMMAGFGREDGGVARPRRSRARHRRDPRSDGAIGHVRRGTARAALHTQNLGVHAEPAARARRARGVRRRPEPAQRVVLLEQPAW